MIALLAAAALSTVSVDVHQTLRLERPGATAAYAVDVEIAQVSAWDGHVAITGRSPGSTQVAIVEGQAIETLQVVVAAPSHLAVLAPDGVVPGTAVASSEYDSETGRFTNGFDAVGRDGGATTTVHLLGVVSAHPAGEDAVASLPAASVSWSRGGLRAVAGDLLVEHSRLTLDGVTIRGAHWAGNGLEVHAGWASPLLYDRILLPSLPSEAAGASWRFSRGESAIEPNVYWFSHSRDGRSAGTVASLVYSLGRADGPFQLRAEGGWGGAPGGALDVRWESLLNRVWLSARHHPADFASPGIGTPEGSFADASWTTHPAPRLSFDLAGSAARYDLATGAEDVASASTELRVIAGLRTSIFGGATAGTAGRDGSSPVRSVTLPVGASWDGSHVGGTAVARWRRYADGTGGAGGRLSARGAAAAFRLSGWIDLQRDAMVASFLPVGSPASSGVDRRVRTIALSAQGPEDAGMLLREGSPFLSSGQAGALDLRLAAWRLQSGAELGWTPAGSPATGLRLRFLDDRVRDASGTHETRISTLSWSQRIGGGLDGVASGTAWTHEGVQDWQWSVGFRLRFGAGEGLPRLFRGRGDLRGEVVPEARGDAGLPSISGMKVVLDGASETRTDAAGRFSFPRVVAGSHRVEVALPDARSYFTTPSSISIARGEPARFGVARATTRIFGTITDDQGIPLPGVGVRLTGALEREDRTDSNGRFVFAVPEGDYQVDADGGSVPPGYDLRPLVTRRLHIAGSAPARVYWVLVANRSISGTVVPGCDSVALLEAGRSATPDANGSFVFRGLQPGSYTLRAWVGSRKIVRVVDVPVGPAAVEGVELGR
jgi:hypothetical protein